MPDRDIGLATYLKAFSKNWLSGMCGILTVPFAAAAILIPTINQKVLWGCLALAAVLVASYGVWRKERTDADAQFKTLNNKITQLSRKPYDDDVEQTVKRVLAQMTPQGRLLVRHLLHRGSIEAGRYFGLTDIPPEMQEQQLRIAREGGVIQNKYEELDQRRNCWIINPRYAEVLKDINLTV